MRGTLAGHNRPDPGRIQPDPTGRKRLYRAKSAEAETLWLDVVHRRARGLVLAVDDVGDRRLGEDGAGGGGGVGEDALGLGAEAAVEEFDDFEDGDLATGSRAKE